VKAVAAGDMFTCALTGGAVACWGILGQNVTQNDVPVFMSGLSSGVASIAAGANRLCDLTTGGAVQCLGGVDLGNGSTGYSNTPVQVTGLTSGVASIAGGYFESCAVTTGGAAQCWGYNWNGDIGNGSTSDSYTPVGVTGLGSGVSSVALGGAHGCAVTTSGAVQCWGYGGNGDLGNNSTSDSTTPVAVSSLSSGVSGVSLGENNTCAVTTAGQALCWGNNDYGQLGNSSTAVQSNVPVTVTGFTSGASAISVGYQHACVLTSSGGVQCWGDNTYGQLGDNSDVVSLVPVAVVEP
jgi:alpha-tubulin suppressor-like RCC1 family protein